jgi:predicted phosphodiesterase
LTVATPSRPRRGAAFQKTRQQRLRSEGTGKTVLIIPDTHYPVQNKRAKATSDKIVEVIAPDEVGFLGDLLDCGQFSKHPVKTMAEQAQDYLECEVKPAQQTFQHYRSLGVKSLWMLEGNHEARVESLFVGAGLVGLLPLVAPKALLSPFLDDWIPYAPQGQAMSHKRLADDLICIHGWGHSKYATSKVLEQAKCFSVIHGHTHRAQAYSDRHPILDREYEAICPGTLSTLQPAWGHGSPTSWSHGAVLVKFNGPLWTAYTIKIKNGEAVLPGGQVVRA